MSAKVEHTKKESINIKTSWSEVTLSEFINIGRIQADEDMKDLKLQQRLRIISIVCDYSYDEILKLAGKNLTNLLEATLFLDKNPPKRNSSKKPFRVGDKEFIFHPNLKEMNAGEQISIEQLLMDAKQQGKNNLPSILAILIRPTKTEPNKKGDGVVSVITDFDASEIEERANFFLEHLTVDKFFHEIAFFLSIAIGNGEATKSSTANLMKVAEAIQKTTTQKKKKKKK